MQGEVVEAFRGGMYRIALDNDHETLGYVSGKMAPLQDPHSTPVTG